MPQYGVPPEKKCIYIDTIIITIIMPSININVIQYAEIFILYMQVFWNSRPRMS